MIFSLNNVTFAHQYQQGNVFTNLSLQLEEGVNTILCDTQSGKTTLCKLLCGVLRPEAGYVAVDGADIVTVPQSDLGVLYLPSNPTFFAGKSVLYNVAYPLKVRGVDKKRRLQMAVEQIARLGLQGLEQTKIKKLNDRQRKLVALARGLTVPRKAVIFDDFFAQDDVASSATPKDLLQGGLSLSTAKSTDKQTSAKGQNNAFYDVLQLFEGITTVVVTSNPLFATGNVVVLDGGSVAYVGNKDGATQTVANLLWLARKIEE